MSLASSALALCSDTTFDGCNKDAFPAFETAKGLNETTCQKLCKDIYGFKCTYFVFDRRDKSCELFDQDNGQDYFGTCNRVGGTAEPSIADCDTANEDCKVRL